MVFAVLPLQLFTIFKDTDHKRTWNCLWFT